MRLTLFLFVLIYANLASAATFDLKAIKSFAHDHSPFLMTQKEDINIQSGEKNIARSALLPTISTEGSYSRYKLQHSVIEGVFGEDQHPAKERMAWDINFNFVIFSFGKDYFNYKSSSRLLKSKETNFKRVWQDLSFQLSKIYYSILAVKKTIEATKATIKSFEELEREIRKKVEVGKLPEVDLLKVEVERSKAIDDLSKLETLEEDLYGQLKRLMGYETNTDFQLKNWPLREIKKRNFELQKLLKQAYANRDDLQSLELTLDSIKYRIKSVIASYFPEIAVRATYTEQAPGATDFVSDGKAGIVISLPIFDGFLRKGQIEKLEAEKRKLLASIKDKRLQINKEVKTALKNYKEALTRVEATKRSVRHAKEVLRIEKLKYELGRSTINFVLEAESALLSARSLFYKAYYDNYIAIDNIRLAIGTLE